MYYSGLCAACALFCVFSNDVGGHSWVGVVNRGRDRVIDPTKAGSIIIGIAPGQTRNASRDYDNRAIDSYPIAIATREFYHRSPCSFDIANVSSLFVKLEKLKQQA